MSQSCIHMAQVETTTACPAHCSMCPRETQRRGHGVMRTDIFKKAVRQAVECGATMVLPFINGEPLADRRMPDFVEWISKEFPNTEIGWYTNGYLLTEEIARRLLCAGGIKTFNISMQGGTKEVYEVNMGLSWDVTVRNVERFIALNKDLGVHAAVNMNMCNFSKTEATIDQFRNRWEPLGAKICIGCFSNFGGMVHDKVEEQWNGMPRLVCDRAIGHTYIYWNGDVGQCCFDLMGTAVWGNLKDQSLREILESEGHRGMVDAHRRLDVAGMPDICHGCNACKFHG